MLKNFEFFFRCRVVSKNKLEIIELFGDIYQIVSGKLIETLFLQRFNDGLAYIYHIIQYSGTA